MAEKIGSESLYDITSSQLLIGKAALAQHIEAGSHPADIVTLREALLDPHLDISSGKNQRLDTRSWDTQDYVTYGRWIASVTELEGAKGLTSRIIDRASKLGLGPSVKKIRRSTKFNKISLLQKEAGLDKDRRRIGYFDEWTTGDFIEHLRHVGEEKGRRPTIETLKRRREQGLDEPHPNLIKQRVGSLPLAYELAGFVSTLNWDRDRYLQWGVEFMQANQGKLPTRKSLDILSKAQRGPSYPGVHRWFGGLISYQEQLPGLFRESVKDEYRQRERKIAQIKQEVKDGTIPTHLFKDIESPDGVIARYAKFRLVNELFPDLLLKQRVALCIYPLFGVEFADYLKQHKESLTVWEVEQHAQKLGIKDDIFPVSERIKYLKIYEGELLHK